RVFDNRRSVRGQEVFILADADDQRAAFSGGDELVRVVEGEHDDRVGADNVVKGETDRLNQRAIIPLLYVFNEMNQYFRIGFTAKCVAFVDKVLPKGGVVLNNAIVNDGQPLWPGGVGVGINVVWSAVGGPPRVSDTDVAVQGHALQCLLEVG